MKEVNKEMKKIVCLFVLLLIALVPPQASQASWPQTSSVPSLEARIDTYLQPLLKANHFSGVILIVQQDKVVYEKGFGLAHAGHNVPNRPDTRFCIASITKSMTRAIAIRLLQERKLGLQDKLSKWVPDFPKGDQITVELLLRHRSGLPHRITKPEEESLRYTPADMVEKAKQAQLVFQPGERSLYSSTGYSVLARVLELASGKTYAQLLQEHIFAPAGMKQAVDFNGETIIPHLAQEYFLDTTGLVNAPLKDYSFIVGAGSVCSTARDVYRFGEAVLDGKYGEGVKLSLTRDGVYSDNGSTNGFRCFTTIDRQKGYGFVVAANLESGANDLLGRDLPKILQGESVAPPKIPTPAIIQMTSAQLAEYVAVYKRDETEFRLRVSDNQLYGANFKFLPVGKDRFFNLGYYAEITFVRNADGTIKELEWDAPGGKSTWTRQPLLQANK